VLYTHQEAEGKRLRNPFDTVTEGVGINRLTRNFAVALGDEKLFASDTNERSRTTARDSLISPVAFRCSDREAVEMSRFLARNDGLFLGSSSCVNVVGAVKAARRLGPGKRVVTIACDGGGAAPVQVLERGVPRETRPDAHRTRAGIPGGHVDVRV
jgi:cysteine synthase A